MSSHCIYGTTIKLVGEFSIDKRHIVDYLAFNRNDVREYVRDGTLAYEDQGNLYLKRPDFTWAISINLIENTWRSWNE